MKGIVFPLKELSSGRFARLCDRLDIKRAEGVGLLLLFWLESRNRNLEAGTRQQLAACLPPIKGQGQNVLCILEEEGYLSRDGEQLLIVDNVGHNAKTERVQAQCRKAALARIQKRAPAPKKALHPVPSKELAPVSTAFQDANRQTWEAYAQAYQRKMGQLPIRNAKTNSLIKQFVQRIGAQDAPHVMVFYVDHPNPLYISRLYQLEMAVKDAESLRTQWANNRPITQGDVMQFDKQMAFERDRQLIHSGRI